MSERRGYDQIAESKENSVLRNRSVIAYLMQMMPWAILILVFSIETIIDVYLIKFSEEYRQFFMYICTGMICAIGIIVALGGLISCKQLSDTTAFLMLILFYIAFTGLAVAYSFLQIIHKDRLVIVCIGIPLLILTLGHVLWALLSKTGGVNALISSCLLLVTIGSSIGLLITMNLSGQTYSPAIFGSIHLLLGASWITAIKFSIRIE